MIPVLVTVHLASVFGLALYGVMGFLTLRLFIAHRNEDYSVETIESHLLPLVTVQLPVFNERLVIERLINAAANLDYPRERLQIQVVDDSNDDTTQIARRTVDRLAQTGVNISLIHRETRGGFKAGALAAALGETSGDFIVIFDADFQPQSDFLQRVMPHFIDNDDLGMVQARWGHTNADESSLTAAQAIALDKHFMMEQTVRHRARLYPKFNGSAGVWRRRCLEDAGGWEADTVCEDLCLSTRAYLRGWEFRFLPDLVAPAELPTTMLAYKNQQARWAEGSSQCLKKYGWQIMRDGRNSRMARAYALFSMAGYTTHILMLLLLLVQVPLILAGYRFPVWFMAISIIGLGQPLLFIIAQQVQYDDWVKRLRHFPAMLIVAIGTAPSNTRAIFRGFLGRQHLFVRTPKGGSSGYDLNPDGLVVVELALAAYAAVGIALAVARLNLGPILLLTACCAGFLYSATSSLRATR